MAILIHSKDIDAYVDESLEFKLLHGIDHLPEYSASQARRKIDDPKL